MTPDQIADTLRASIDQTVQVTYTDGKTEEVLVHTVDDEGFACDIARSETSDPPEYAYWVRFTDVSAVRKPD
jgi:hypothetical protein